ncbi:hypothetical protein HDV06_003862, partial [Boothiomyces sp. JEL0866]
GDSYCTILYDTLGNLSLKSIKIPNITNVGLEALVSRLDTSQLTRLDFSFSQIDDKCTASLGIFLPLSSLEELILFQCKISDSGLLVIGKFVEYTKLTLIDLRKNLVTITGARELEYTLKATLRRCEDYELKESRMEVLLFNPPRIIK